MKTAFCYFTGTGNSLYAAQCVAKQVGESDFYRLHDLADTMYVLERYAKIGFFFPIYGMGLPDAVKRFFENLNYELAGRYFFAVLTHGGPPLDCVYKTWKLFDDAGFKLNYVNHVRMPGNCTIVYPAPSEQSALELTRKAEKKLSVIGADIQASLERTPLKVALGTKAGNKLFSMAFAPRDKAFMLTAACDGCGLCARACPVDNIVMQDGKPRFQHRCELCLGCFHRCPKGAVNYGRSTVKKPRYINPKVKFLDRE